MLRQNADGNIQGRQALGEGKRTRIARTKTSRLKTANRQIKYRLVHLKGLLRCGHCNSAMTTSYSLKGSKKYRYYRCHSHHKEHNVDCPNSILSAPKFEQKILEYLNPVNQMEHFHQFDQTSIRTLSKITDIWHVLFPSARSDIIHDLVKSVSIMGNEDEIEIDFSMEGIQRLSKGLSLNTTGSRL